MNNYFINIIKGLSLKRHTTANTMDRVQITSTLNNYRSVKKIREFFLEISSNDNKNRDFKVKYQNIISKWLYSSKNFETVC